MDYGSLHVDVYDALYPEPHPAAIPTLTGLARGGRCLELGVGTGRLAIPLSAQGLDVVGVDLSGDMLAVLTGKPGAEKVATYQQDMADFDVPGSFDLVYVVGSSFYHLLSQQQQIRCLERVAAALNPQGLFLCHGYLPDPLRWKEGIVPRREGSRAPTHFMLDASWHDPVEQRVSARLVYFHDKTFDVLPIEHRYVWPAELDLMARSVGLRPVERWASWDRSPLRPHSEDVFHLFRRAERAGDVPLDQGI